MLLKHCLLIYTFFFFSFAGCSSTQGTHASDEKAEARRMPANFTGTWYHWHDNGVISAKYEFENGNYHGLRQEWNDQGVLIQEETIINMQVVGLYREWYPNGQLMRRIDYGEGGDGPISSEQWDEDGNLIVFPD